MSDIALSHGQEAMWALYAADPGSPRNAIRALFRLSPEANPDHVVGAVARLYARHPLLRARIENHVGVLRLRVDDASGVPDEEIVLGPCDTKSRDMAIGELSLRPFDLEHGPLVRFSRIVRSAGSAPFERLLLIVMHHIIGDFASLDVLAGEFETCFASTAGRAPELPPAPWPWPDHVARERSWVAGEAATKSVEFWRRRFDAVPGPDRRQAGPLVAIGGRGLECRESVDPDLCRQLRSAARRYGVCLSSLAMCAFAIAVNPGAESALLSTPINLRINEAQRNCVGLYVNVLPVALELPRRAKPAELASTAEREVRHAVAHRRMPFPILLLRLREYGIGALAEASRSLFSWIRYAPGFSRTGTTTIEDTLRMEGQQPVGVSNDLVLTIADRGTWLDCSWAWNPQVHGECIRSEFMPRFRAVLEALASDSAEKLDELRFGAGVLVGERREQVLI